MMNTISNKTKHKMNLILGFMKDDIFFLDTCFEEDENGNYKCEVDDFIRGYENLSNNISRISGIIEENNLVFLIDDIKIITENFIFIDNLFKKMYCIKNQSKFFDKMIHYKNILKNLIWYVCVLENKFNHI